MIFFLQIALLHWMALITPGPDFFLVMQTALEQSFKKALSTILGIVLGCMFWCLLAILGLHTVLQKYPLLNMLISLLGAGYLAYLGYLMLSSFTKKSDFSTASVSAKPHSAISLFTKGLLVNLSNPKVILYFASILALIISQINDSYTIVTVTLLIAIETTLWFTLVALIFTNAKIKQLYLTYSRYINALSGLVFIGFALWLVYTAINI